MKKILLAAALLATVFTANAQSDSNSCQDIHTFSVKPFVGTSQGMWLNKNTNTDMRTGFTAGVEGQYQFSKAFALSVGVQYQQQGGKLKDNMIAMTDGSKRLGDRNLKMDYINVPIMANFYVCKGLALKVGIQPGYAVSTKVNTSLKGSSETKSETITDQQMRKFDIAIPMGLSYEFSHVVFDARVNVGTIGLIKGMKSTSDYNPTNGVAQFTVGYRF